jgi:hypothetical protein
MCLVGVATGSSMFTSSDQICRTMLAIASMFAVSVTTIRPDCYELLTIQLPTFSCVLCNNNNNNNNRETLYKWKPNCALVMIDFALRHGMLDPDEPDFLELAHSLRSGWHTNAAH